MPKVELLFTREIDLPPVIVWDAFVDRQLLVGWLGELRRSAQDSNAFELRWLGPDAAPTTSATLLRLVPLVLIAVHTDNRGDIELSLDETDGGTRGSGTRLRVRFTVDVERAFLPRVTRSVERSLDRLERLLSGHPTDWSASEVIRRSSATRTTTTRSNRP